MTKKMIINANMAEEIRIAIVENKKIIDLDIETQNRNKHKGNIYKGIVANIEDGLEAAFIEFGEEKQAFLPLSDIRQEFYKHKINKNKKIKISEFLSKGQEIIIQITKDEIGTKGAAATTYLSLPGRYMVLMHSDDSSTGISKKIENTDDRRAAKEILSQIQVPDCMSVIIRTAGVGASKDDLIRDLKSLSATWEQIDRGCQIGRAPTLLYREPDLVVRTIRDYLSEDISSIHIDDEEEFEDVFSYFEERMPSHLPLLNRHKRKEPIFQYHNIETSIEELYQRKIMLPSGGYIVIDETEALVAIDVNSGRSNKERDHESTAFKTNMEAAQEAGRQLRLRNLGGIIIIDFIDMVLSKHNKEVEKKLRSSMITDKAKIKIGRISDNGTLELTRQRIKTSHRVSSHIECKSCNGTGLIRDVQGLSIRALRKLSGHLSKRRTQLAGIKMLVPVEVANHLSNHKREELLKLQSNYNTKIEIIGNVKLFNQEIEFIEERRGQAGLIMSRGNRSHKNQDRSKQPADINIEDVNKSNKDKLPVSIGPAPVFVKNNFINAEQNQSDTVNHYDDPTKQAFFGDAKKDLYKKYSFLDDDFFNAIIDNEKNEHK